MARQHGGELFDFNHMTDEEIREIVVQHLREYSDGLDPDWITVLVKDGFVTLSGRVGTDSERQLAESVIHDVLGLQDYANDLVVDELHRDELPEGADEAIALQADRGDQIGGVGLQTSDTAQHLMENVEEETFGTHDMGTAIEEGMPYIPPDRPVGDGYDSRENH